MFRQRNIEIIEVGGVTFPSQFDKKIQIIRRYAKASGQGLAITDLQGNIVSINDAASKMLDIKKPRKMSKTDISKYYTNESNEHMRNSILPFLLKNDQWTGNFSLKNNKGNTVPITITIFLLRDPQKIPRCLVNIFRRVTEYKTYNVKNTFHTPIHNDQTARLEKINNHSDGKGAKKTQLKSIAKKSPNLVTVPDIEGNISWFNKSRSKIAGWLKDTCLKEQQRTIADASTQLTWIADVDGKPIYHSPQYVKYTGFKNKNAQDWETIIHPEDFPHVQKKWKEGIRSQCAIQTECRIRRHDGEYLWFMVNCETKLSSDGRIKKCIGSATEIDGLKKTQSVLQDKLDILAEAERIGNSGSWRKNVSSNLIMVSSGTRRIMGLSETDEVTFEKFTSQIHPDDQSSFSQKVQNIFIDGIPFTTEFNVLNKGKGYRHIIARAEAKCDAGGRWDCIHGTLQDITDQKWMEEELIKAQKLESIGTLAAGIAHDYNNLLTGIMGNLELAKVRTSQDDPIFTFLARAEKSSLAARDLTSHLLTFAEKNAPLKKNLQLGDTLTKSIRLALTGSNIKPELEIADDLPPVNGDENQLHQAIHNIVMNAREAMPAGGKLFIKAEGVILAQQNPLSLREGSYACLTFRDEGRGIAHEHLSKIFDPYFSTKTLGSTKGMGLGLSICYSIIKRHDGHIHIDSKAGSGTTVTMHIPGAHRKSI